ncbi:MAG: histidine kinase [Burkholderiales bacterium]|nr:histidine kinase [Burkholderiales bacterium]
MTNPTPIVTTRLPQRILKSITWVAIFNTLISLFLTFVLRVDERFTTIWVFSMLVGCSISVIIHLLRWLIWRNARPHRLSFLFLCVVAAPIGYYLGLTAGLLLYGQKIPNIMSLFGTGNRAIVIMSAFISLISGLFFWNQAKIAELQAEQEKEKARTAAIERQALQAQLQLLQAQIEPHMLFNTLANLQGLIAIDPARAQHMLEQLIHYLRASLNSSRVDNTTLKHEFELMQAYLELLAIRMGKRLHYRCELPEELEQQTIAPMLIQPLVENAIKHGVEPKMEGGSVHVSAEKIDSTLHIKIIDTGLGLSDDHDQLKQHDANSHVGNANIRERLLALYGNQASLRLTPNQPEGCIAHLQIPLA